MALPTGIPFYSEGKDLLEKARKIWEEHRVDQIQRTLDQAVSSLEDPKLYEFLEWLYGSEHLLRRAGHVYPVLSFPCPDRQSEDLESVLNGGLQLNVPGTDELVASDASYRAMLEALGRPLEERPTYTMVRMRIDDPIQLEAELGTYLRAVDSCDSLEWELLSEWSKLKPSSVTEYPSVLDSLPLRKLLHDEIDNPILNGSGRSAAIGVSTLIAFPIENQVFLWTRKRSYHGVAVHPGLLHVIPAGMFQPRTPYLRQEYSVSHSVFREYLEEVFNRPEDPGGEEPTHYRYFYGDPCLQYLLQLLETRQAKLMLTGMAVNLLNLRPEICTLLYVETPEWHQHHSDNPDAKMRFAFNEEYATVTEDLNSFISNVAMVPHSFDDKELIEYGQLVPSRFVAPGAAAFWMGVDTLRGCMGEAANNSLQRPL